MLSLAGALHLAQEAGGVTILGRLPRADLERELCEASCFAYPVSVVRPCETFSVSIMECCKIGVPVVLSPADSLEAIYDGYVKMVKAPASEHMPEFTDAVVKVLTDPLYANKWSRRGRQLAARYTFEREAETLDTIIQTHLVKVETKAAAE